MLNDLRTSVSFLRDHCYPFSMLSGNRATEALESLKVYELDTEDELSLRPGTSVDSLYVVEGEVEVTQEGAPCILSVAETKARPYRIEVDAGAVRVRALTPAIVARADGELLDYLLSWETLADVEDAGRDPTHGRIATVRRSLAFRRLPLEAVEEAFRRMRSQSVKAGDDVVRQGEVGDAFYVIESGRAEVWRTGIYDDEPQMVAELGEGDSFGEEALVLKGSRNATVRMAEDGNLLVLDHADFDELFNASLVQKVDAGVARAYLDSGYVPLDVRYEEELDDGFLPGAQLIPLHELRKRVGELDPGKSYVTYCKSGGRSAVAALLLKQRNFHVVSLAGGLRDWPGELSLPTA
jgi:rhodanese-related sulfurtransferase